MARKKMKKASMDGQAPRGDKKDLADKIAMGATGVALAAGTVAAGALLMKQQNREMLGKRVAETTRALGSALSKTTNTMAPLLRVMQKAFAPQLKRNQASGKRGRKASKR